VRIDLRRGEPIKHGSEIVGGRVKAKIVKNKVATPFRFAQYDIMYGEGISKQGDIIDLGVEMGLIQKSGAFLSYGDTRLGQGRENAKEFLHQNVGIAQELEEKIRTQANIPAKPANSNSKADS
jgi:recombination protein RecA